MQAIVVSSAAADPANRGVLKALAGLNWRITAAVPHRWQAPGQEAPLLATTGEDGGVRIVPITVRRTRGQTGTAGGGRWDSRRLRRLVKDVRPDLVHIEAEPTARVASVVTGMGRSLDIPSVLVTWEGLPRSYTLRERVNRTRSLSRLRGLVAGTSRAADLIRKEYPHLPNAVIPEAVLDIPSSIPPRPDERFAIAFSGRLIAERGLDLLFKACARLPCSWSIRVMGTGPEQEALEQLAEGLGIASRVTWHGGLPRSARRDLWPEVDCIAVPSRRTPTWVEAKTPILLEAMSHGVAVVAADSGSLPELVADAGIVVPEGEIDSLTQALERASAPNMRHEMGRAARQRIIQQFSPTAVAKRTVEAWTRFLGGGE